MLKTENVFHQILSQAKRRPQQETWIACVSGGLDSVALLQVLNQVSQVTGHKLYAVHIHHGAGASIDQANYRAKAFKMVSDLCQGLQISLKSNWEPTQGVVLPSFPAQPASQSEACLREFRWESIKKLTHAEGSTLTFLTGHHQDDVLETRLIQLIRGVGPEGLVQFRSNSPGIWRPLFEVSKHELKALALRQGWKWVEDPSNQSRDPLRNWMRQTWLTQLEQKRPGALKSLHRSLELVVEGLKEVKAEEVELKEKVLTSEGIRRFEFGTLSRQRQMQFLAHFLRAQSLKGYTKGQLEEVLKRLESNQKRFEFRISQLLWKVDNSLIRASRV